MQLKTVVHAILLTSSLLLLNACSAPGNGSKSGDQYTGTYDGNGARTSGLGDSSNYGDAGSQRSLVMQRTYYFDFDRSAVRDEYKPAIYANANYLMQHPNMKIIVEGHTDPRGSREYNVALGESRANAVADLLRSKGVNATQIRVVSYGSERPAVSGHDEEAFQKDRRAVIVRLQG